MATDGAAAPDGAATGEAEAASGAANNSMEALMNAKIAFFISDPLFCRSAETPPARALGSLEGRIQAVPSWPGSDIL
ncbi:hypothetical protein GCM10023346_40400 [Arthrobacter gyeryongensis]|uniref:Uncharacterized protein n=1 Tax=Arthrobacter gyeryongensis TaxID=1650592 RepID=A0ABP9SRI6_9MICC